MEFTPFGDLVVEIVRSHQMAEKNGFVDARIREFQFKESDPIIAMCNRAFYCISAPRGVGKSYGIAKAIIEVAPHSLVLAPHNRQLELVDNELQKLELKSTRPKPMVDMHMISTLTNTDYDAVFVEEWNTIPLMFQLSILKRFHPQARDNPGFAIFAFQSGL